MKKFTVYSPKNLDDALRCLKTATGQTKLLAGGTDFVIQLREGSITPDTVIDISGVQELKCIKEEDGFLKIGAACTFTQISESNLVQQKAFCLAQAASEVGSEQVRNAGTIGGNIANASPAADSLPALVALNAEVTIVDANGKSRSIPVEKVSAGVGKNNLVANEIITEINIPLLGEDWRTAFCKLGRRKALAIARINMALVVRFDESAGLIKDARIALGAVGTVAFRTQKAEGILVGNKPSRELMEKFAETVSTVVEESIPTRSSMPYKRTAVKGLAFDIFEKLFSDSLKK
ncbi:MAG: xanthine dehydrogenase FAD-binding subunit [Clostridia bacterium]|jgi:CO/xanthine dehydrogenase FAD-binding subunit|nr:hypothetical protein [Clostridiales bacterium]MDK2985601.1 xanthine dehydrogenase FAD-binding subunit [Clostridia bacterium]